VRLLDAAIVGIARSGSTDLSLPAICRAAGLRYDAFADSYADRTDLLLAVFDELAAHTVTVARIELLGHSRWDDGVRAALAALLELADRRPHLAAFLLGSAGPQDHLIHRRREHLRRRLALLLDEHRPAPAAGVPSPAFGSAAVVAATAAILRARLSARSKPRLGDLQAPLMAMIVLPYLGAEGARAEIRAAPRIAGAAHG
jgi:AcrR family transcriptional regulator